MPKRAHKRFQKLGGALDSTATGWGSGLGLGTGIGADGTSWLTAGCWVFFFCSSGLRFNTSAMSSPRGSISS